MQPTSGTCHRRIACPTIRHRRCRCFERIVQTPTLVVELFEQDPHYRQIFVDGRAHPKDLDPTWLLAPGEEILEYVCTENNKFERNTAAQ